MNADPATQLRLLDLQAADTELAQLAYRREHLPELAAIAAADQQYQQSRGEAVDVQAQLDDFASDQRRLENEIDTVQTRSKRDDQRLTAGGMPAKELEGLQHEITTLARRQSTLEDELLEVMEQRAPLRRNTDPDEVADAAVFLASRLSRGITGEVLFVDAGFHATGL